jgi:hypothetical protein
MKLQLLYDLAEGVCYYRLFCPAGKHWYRNINHEETKNTKKSGTNLLYIALRALRFFVVCTNLCCSDLARRAPLAVEVGPFPRLNEGRPVKRMPPVLVP